MKKQNNILRVINKLLCITLACSLFHSCADEEIISSTKVETGIPVEVQLGMSISGMSEVSTRSLDENAESQVNDLYVLIFDANSQQKKTGKFFSTDEIVSTTTNKNKGSIVLKTTSGECRIYAVANVATTELTGTNLKSQLDNVSKISDLNNITAALTEVNIQRVQAALSMSGVYKATNQPNKAEGYCVINEEGNVSAGKIELNRLDSHITFKIAVGSEVKTFTPISWQVKNVPLKSTVFPQEKSVFTNSDDFAEESSISKAFGTVTNDKVYRTFDFYMLENVKSAKEYNGEKITADVSNMDIQERQAEYAKREAEEKIKDPDNKDKVINTGTYKFSEPFATYVEIKASMEIAHKEDGKDVTRVANVTYIIHLGGGTDDPANFTSNRNTKYTYKIQINNVDNIVVEVEEDKENRPGEEGDVVDAEVEARTLDAHYNSFVMGFSYNDVADENGKNALQFVVKTPFGTVTNKDQADATSNISNPQDYHWIHFKQNTGKDPDKKLALHNGTIIDIFNLGDDIIKRYNNDTAKDKSKTKQYFYTVFVDEYYYSKPPKGENWGNDATTYWRHFANAADRYIMLVYAPKYSTDNESSYAKARYMLTQRSIQTYYSTESGIALGMEHINETGAATIWGNITDAVSYNGLWNTWQYLKNNNSWDSHVTRTSWDQNMNTFTTQNEAVVVARCLSRNRDENGDGIITANEVKWYVPTSEQLMGMYLGAKSLPSPLVDSENINFIYSERGNYHYSTSDKKRIWGEEGASVGDLYADGGNAWGAGSAQNFRCVRNLGIDITQANDIKKETYPKQAFEYKEKATVKVYNKILDTDETVDKERIFVMSKLTDQNIRSRLQQGELAIHNNFEDGNKPAYAFQMAKNKTESGKGNQGDPFTITTWERVIRSYWYDWRNWEGYYRTYDGDRSWCKNYTEEKNERDKGLWRAPNQREMMLMYIHDSSNVNNTLSRTLWKYKTGNEKDGYTRFFCTSGNLTLSNDGTNGSANERMGTLSIRCVRDVEIVK